MILMGMLLAAFFISASEMQQQYVSQAIQDKFEYRNLFDTCINNKDIFEALRDPDNFDAYNNYTVDVYNNYLNASSALLKKSFKLFIERNKSEALNYTRFRKLKGLAYAYSLIDTSDISLIPLLENNHFDNFLLSNALKQTVKKERALMLTKFEEFSVISKIFTYAIIKMQGMYQTKDNIGEFYSKDIEKPLRRFCKYAYLMNTCYLLAL